MRPVNLIPPEERRGERAPLRTGGLSYLVVGALALLLAAVTALVLTDNQVSDREAEVARLGQEEATLGKQAEKLSAFADFRSMQEARAATVTSLAQSRFDWERVMRELSLVLPDDVWLVQLTGTVSSEAGLETAVGIAGRDEVTGPALELVGCAESHDAVGRFVTALGDIDGVTRVAAPSSTRGDAGSGSSGSTGGEAGGDCRTRNSIVQFQIVAAFDEVQVDPATVPPVAAPATSAEGEGVAEAQAQRAESREDVESKTERGRKAVDYIPGS